MDNGTIYRTVYNSLGEAVSDWVGTNDMPTSGEWSPTNSTGTANMVEVSSYQYDAVALDWIIWTSRRIG